jgi:hydroxyacylglutathione hydrolase
VESNKECYIIDPTFDDKILKDFIKKRGSILKYVVMTHYHADFLSAHVNLGAPIIMGPNSKRTVNKFDVK